MLLFNPHNLLAQKFLKKGIFKERETNFWKRNYVTENNQQLIHEKYAGIDGFPCTKIEEENLLERRLLKIILNHSIGSQPCKYSQNNLNLLNLIIKERKSVG
jgi:hypothetical protein